MWGSQLESVHLYNESVYIPLESIWVDSSNFIICIELYKKVTGSEFGFRWRTRSTDTLSKKIINK